MDYCIFATVSGFKIIANSSFCFNFFILFTMIEPNHFDLPIVNNIIKHIHVDITMKYHTVFAFQSLDFRSHCQFVAMLNSK